MVWGSWDQTGNKRFLQSLPYSKHIHIHRQDIQTHRTKHNIATSAITEFFFLLNSDWRLWIAGGLGGHLPRHTAVNLVALTCSSAQGGTNNVCVFQLLVFWFLLVIVVVLERLVMGNRVVLRVERPRPVQLMLAQVFLVILLAAAWAENQDYYSLLGVSKEATTREIRRAFKKLALTMHPDKNQVSLLWETRNTDFTLKQKPLTLQDFCHVNVVCLRATPQPMRSSWR